MSRPRALTQTSYVLLALVAVEPRSAYQLAHHLTTSILRASWPRAEAGLYAELKLLAESGLLHGKPSLTGRRSRLVYELSPAGRAALAEWFADPSPAAPALEWILPTKLMFTDIGGRVAFNTTLQHARAQLTDRIERMAALRTYELQRPDRLQVNVIGQLLLARLHEALVNWLEDVERLDASRNRKGTMSGDAVKEAHEAFFRVHEDLLVRLRKQTKR